jgi:hypothetical protein
MSALQPEGGPLPVEEPASLPLTSVALVVVFFVAPAAAYAWLNWHYNPPFALADTAKHLYGLLVLPPIALLMLERLPCFPTARLWRWVSVFFFLLFPLLLGGLALYSTISTFEHPLRNGVIVYPTDYRAGRSIACATLITPPSVVAGESTALAQGMPSLQDRLTCHLPKEASPVRCMVALYNILATWTRDAESSASSAGVSGEEQKKLQIRLSKIATDVYLRAASAVLTSSETSSFSGAAGWGGWLGCYLSVAGFSLAGVLLGREVYMFLLLLSDALQTVAPAIWRSFCGRTAVGVLLALSWVPLRLASSARIAFSTPDDTAWAGAIPGLLLIRADIV